MTDRVSELKTERKVFQNELAERTSIKELPADLGSPKNIAIIQAELKKIILNSTPQVVKRYLGFLVEHIVMNGEQVTITLKNEGIMAVLEQKEKLSTGGYTPVLNSIYIWRPKCKVVKYSCTTIVYASIIINTNTLRFNPVQIGEWLAELLELGVFKSRRDMAQEFGLHHSRIGQFLALMKLPVKERRRYKKDDEVREYELRALRCG